LQGRLNTYRKQDKIRIYGRSITESYACILNRLQRFSQFEFYTIVLQLFGKHACKLTFQVGHDLACHFHQGYSDAALSQSLDHLQADEPTADNYRLFRFFFGNVAIHPIHVIEGPQLKHMALVHTWKRWDDGFAALGENERIIRKSLFLIGLRIAGDNYFILSIDGKCLGLCMDLDPVLIIEGLFTCQYQRRTVSDVPSQVIGKPAVCERNVSSSFQQGNIDIVVQSSGSGGSGSSGCNPADY